MSYYIGLRNLSCHIILKVCSVRFIVEIWRWALLVGRAPICAINQVFVGYLGYLREPVPYIRRVEGV